MDTVHEPFHAEPFANGTHSEETDTFFIESGIDHHKIKTGFNEKGTELKAIGTDHNENTPVRKATRTGFIQKGSFSTQSAPGTTD